MPNPESFTSSVESSGEDAASIKARGQKVSEAFAEQNKSNAPIFKGMSREEFNNFDVSKLSPEELERAKQEILAMRAALVSNPQSTDAASAEVSNSAHETVSKEAARATAEKTKQDPQAKDFISKKAMAALLAVSIAAGGIIGYFGANMQNASAE